MFFLMYPTSTQYSLAPSRPSLYVPLDHPTPNADQVPPPFVESCLPVTEEFELVNEVLRSVPMLRILLILLKHPSLLPISVRRVILSHIWGISWDPSIEYERGEVISDIIALEASETEKIRVTQPLPPAWSTPTCRNMSLSLVSRLGSRILEGTADDATTTAYLNLLFQRLPPNYTTDNGFTEPLNAMVGSFEALSPGNPSVKLLASSLMEFGFQGRLPTLSTGISVLQWPLPAADSDFEEFRSIPVLKILRTLFRSPFALQDSTRKAIVAHLWARFWFDSGGDGAMQRMEVVADILALGAVEVESLRNGDDPAWEELVERSHYRKAVVILASRLCSRMAKKDWLGTASLNSCLKLLQHYLPLQHPDTPVLFEGLVRIVTDNQQQDPGGGYILCLRIFLADLMVSQTMSSSGQTCLDILQKDLPNQLECLLLTLNEANLNEWHGVLGLALSMTLWEHFKYDESLASEFYTPSFAATITNLISQQPPHSYWRMPITAAEQPVTDSSKLTHLEGFYMLDRLSSYLSQVFQRTDNHVNFEGVNSLYNSYRAWCDWLQDSKVAEELSLGVAQSVSRLGDEVKRHPNHPNISSAQPIVSQEVPPPSPNEGTGDSGPTHLRSALSSHPLSRPGVSGAPQGNIPRRARPRLPVRFEEKSSVDSGSSTQSPIDAPHPLQAQPHQSRRSSIAAVNTRQPSDPVVEDLEGNNRANGSTSPGALNSPVEDLEDNPTIPDLSSGNEQSAAGGPRLSRANFEDTGQFAPKTEFHPQCGTEEHRGLRQDSDYDFDKDAPTSVSLSEANFLDVILDPVMESTLEKPTSSFQPVISPSSSRTLYDVVYPPYGSGRSGDERVLSSSKGDLPLPPLNSAGLHHQLGQPATDIMDKMVGDDGRKAPGTLSFQASDGANYRLELP